MRNTAHPPLDVHVSADVLGKLAAVAGRDVPGVEDVEGVYVQAARWDGPAPFLRLCLTARPGADAHRLAPQVRRKVVAAVQRFSGVHLGEVEIDFMPRTPRKLPLA